MDPNACLEQIRQHVIDGDLEAAEQSANDLKEWLENGGFQPELPVEVSTYLITALWSSNDESDESGGDPIDRNYGIEDVAPDFLCRSVVDVFRFLWENRGLIQGNFTGHSPSGYTDDERAAHDFWLTRNNHGAGFWDGDWETGDELAVASQKYREMNPYITDDGKVDCE